MIYSYNDVLMIANWVSAWMRRVCEDSIARFFCLAVKAVGHLLIIIAETVLAFNMVYSMVIQILTCSLSILAVPCFDDGSQLKKSIRVMGIFVGSMSMRNQPIARFLFLLLSRNALCASLFCTFLFSSFARPDAAAALEAFPSCDM
jgi:hypothetical protein